MEMCYQLGMKKIGVDAGDWSANWAWGLPLIVVCFLETQWPMIGALESLNGMLLFGLTTAFLFAMIQKVWPSKGIVHRQKYEDQGPAQ